MSLLPPGAPSRDFVAVKNVNYWIKYSSFIPRPAKAGAGGDPQAPELVLVALGGRGCSQTALLELPGFIPWGFLCFSFGDEAKEKGRAAAAPPSSAPDCCCP